jgi:hypothetical protein
VAQLRPYYGDIRALNTEVIVISFETGYWLQVWLAEMVRATDEALNQLITRQLVLQAASRQNFVLDDALIESRVELLFGANWVGGGTYYR